MNKKIKETNFKKRDSNGNKKIIAAAFELFATKGYTQTSVDSIAAKAKISKGLVYYYFKSKEEILKSIFASLATEAGILYEGTENLSAKQFLKKIIDDSFQFITGQTKLFRLIFALTVQPEVVKGLKKELESLRKIWMADLIKAFETLGYEKPETEAYLLCAMFDG
ncbi:MAG TPA: TetR/AcrR family transcriptional regulator, partial [Sorangium sp.]|nr:TetR/AcrR family transcriptional regulator [Sorangium sp.]